MQFSEMQKRTTAKHHFRRPAGAAGNLRSVSRYGRFSDRLAMETAHREYDS